MSLKSLRALVLLSIIILILLLLSRRLEMAKQARGKGAAVPLQGTLTPEEQRAQDLVLSDARVQAHTINRRSEVVDVNTAGALYTAVDERCAAADCRRVVVYSFETNTTITAMVNLDSGDVLDVWPQPGLQPVVNGRLAARALEIALNAPQVSEALGYQPETADMAPVGAGLVNSACEVGHLCVGPTFNVGNRVLWAIVDLTAEEVAGLNWTVVSPDGEFEPFHFDGNCPQPGSVVQDGWSLHYETTTTDGLHVYDVTYQGMPVLASVKLVEWHVDYGVTGFLDPTGCDDNIYTIPAYGETEVLPLTDGGEEVGFEVVQDFRMPEWGARCNYRYEQHLQFYEDGRFRVVVAAFGRGCSDLAVYRPVVRIDTAVNGDGQDFLDVWDGDQWQPQLTETYRAPYEDPQHGPHAYTEEGYSWRVRDQFGAGYYIEPGQGQFDDNGRGDSPFFYVTRHRAAEGDGDLPTFSSAYCCREDYQQGPHLFLDDETVSGENIVLWYVPQFVTDSLGDDGDPPYCWTQNGEDDPETYPCFGGPLFVPFWLDGVTVNAGFEVNADTVALGDTAVFTNTSGSNVPLTYTWDFGDGTGTAMDVNPTYRYPVTGTFTVTLTASGPSGESDTATRPVEVVERWSLHIPFLGR